MTTQLYTEPSAHVWIIVHYMKHSDILDRVTLLYDAKLNPCFLYFVLYLLFLLVLLFALNIEAFQKSIVVPPAIKLNLFWDIRKSWL